MVRRGESETGITWGTQNPCCRLQSALGSKFSERKASERGDGLYETNKTFVSGPVLPCWAQVLLTPSDSPILQRQRLLASHLFAVSLTWEGRVLPHMTAITHKN